MPASSIWTMGGCRRLEANRWCACGQCCNIQIMLFLLECASTWLPMSWPVCQQLRSTCCILHNAQLLARDLHHVLLFLTTRALGTKIGVHHKLLPHTKHEMHAAGAAFRPQLRSAGGANKPVGTETPYRYLPCLAAVGMTCDTAYHASGTARASTHGRAYHNEVACLVAAVEGRVVDADLQWKKTSAGWGH